MPLACAWVDRAKQISFPQRREGRFMQSLRGLMGQKEEESWIGSFCLAVELGHQASHVFRLALNTTGSTGSPAWPTVGLPPA